MITTITSPLFTNYEDYNVNMKWHKICRENRDYQLCYERYSGEEFLNVHSICKWKEILYTLQAKYRNRPNVINKLCKYIRLVNKRLCPLCWTTSFTFQSLTLAVVWLSSLKQIVLFKMLLLKTINNRFHQRQWIFPIQI